MTLKQAIIQTPVLALPDFQKTFVVETDASGIGIGGVLQQEGHPIAYLSKTLAPKHQSLSTYEKEFLAVLMALDKLATPFQTKWLPKLLGFDYEISYNKGTKNIVVDALSRINSGSELNVMVLSTVTSELLQKIQANYVQDTSLQKTIEQLTQGVVIDSKYQWEGGVLKRKGKLVVGKDEQLRTTIVQHYHADAVGGHSGTLLLHIGWDLCSIGKGCIRQSRNLSESVMFAKEMTTSVVTNSVFRGFFEKQRLFGPNFIDWYRQFRIVLSVMDKLDYLEQSIPPAPVPAQVGQQVAPEALAAHAAWVKVSKEIVGIMLMTMELEIQLDLENLSAYEMLQELKTLFAQKAYQGFLQTVQNFSMHGMRKTVNELHAILKLHEQTQPKQIAHVLHGRNKHAYGPKPKISPPLKKKNHAKDSICHQCGDTSHWKRNYPQNLAELLKNMKLSQGASGSGIFTIEIYTFPNKPWVYETSCGTHICNTTQGLKGSRKLKPGALSLYVGNGQRAAVEAIGTYHLCLPSGLVIVLNNCHYAPSITRGIILVSRLYDDGYVNCFVDNTIQVSRNNMVYFSVVPRDGIFEIDLSNSNTIDSSMYVVNNKRAKLNLDSTLLWHCRLGHISKKRNEKFQHDGLPNSTDHKAFEKCVSCMFRKMAQKPYTHQVKRAKDLLGLIHINVCGPFKITSRQGASYFV
ncbi:retrotransposon protein, putative, ty1-copia subclass, partial [Tanacetum coccineum]